MAIKEKIAIKLLLFGVRVCLNYSYNEEFKNLHKELTELLSQEEKK